MLTETATVRIYTGRLPGSKQHPGAKNQQVFVIEHAVGHNEPLVPYVGAVGEDIDPAWLAGLAQLGPVAEQIAGVAPNSRLDIDFHHHVQGFSHPQRNSAFGTEQPIVVTELAIWGQHRDLRQRRWTRPPQLPPANTVAEALVEHQRIEAYNLAYQKHPRISDTQRKTLRRQARIETAKRTGSAVRKPEFWKAITGSSDLSELEKYHDGLLHRAAGGDSLSRHYLFFMERFGNQCKHKLKTSHGSSKITTTTTTKDQYGNVQGTPRSEERLVYYDYPYGTALETHFNRLWNQESDGPSAGAVFGQVFAYLRNPNRAARDLASLADIVSRPARHLGNLFDTLDCNDPSLEQIRINLLRASQNRPSIQDARQNSFGQQQNQATSDARLVKTEMTGRAHVRYSYTDTPAGWRPNSPEKLLAATHNYIAPHMQHHVLGWVPSMLEIEVMAPAAHSLAQLSVTRFGLSDASPLFWMRQHIKDKNIDLPNLNPQQLVVVCEYRNAQPIMFWFPTRLAGADVTSLKAIDPRHPMLAIGDPRPHCPAIHKG